MSATVRTNHGEYTGQNIESIVRREYGRKAFIQGSNVLVENPLAGAKTVLATVLEATGDHDAEWNRKQAEHEEAMRGLDNTDI